MLDLLQLSDKNRTRCDRWHTGAQIWTGADWSNAMCGEAGEAANVVKKLRRHEAGIKFTYNTPSRMELHHMLAGEIADVIVYADLLALYYGIVTADAVKEKFNTVSIA